MTQQATIELWNEKDSDRGLSSSRMLKMPGDLLTNLFQTVNNANEL